MFALGIKAKLIGAAVIGIAILGLLWKVFSLGRESERLKTVEQTLKQAKKNEEKRKAMLKAAADRTDPDDIDDVLDSGKFDS